ncbi:MDR family MFS transporter [Staphylococcus auricularis]|uniref:MDR family MFS transporter n=1 Tax=Staphylococcus auricularis TaxID=29379 RepID=UPI0012456D4B|nr:MDR family MFS transporter [Staphylococcus auricularis]HJE01488.1 multidrug efflux MFS transporter [Staphylococcus auricularis]
MSENTMTKSKRNIIVTVMLVSAFVAMLNQTILNTALPVITEEMNITETTAQWLITGFMLVNGIMIPLTAFFMERYTTRALYIFSMATFVLGSIVSAFAPNFAILMTARVIQAVGAGVLLPLMQFTVFTLFPVEKRGFAMGLTGIVAQSAPAIGPTVTGLLIDHFSWRMPFLIVAAIALLAFVIGALFVQNKGETKAISLDKISVVYSTFGFGLVLYAFSSVGQLGLKSPLVYITFIVGVIIITIFVLRQLKMDTPLLKMDIFKNKTFTLSSIGTTFVFIGIVGPALLIPIYIQDGLGLSALLSGIVILPGAIVNAFISVYTGKIYDRFGAKVLIIPGFTLLTIMTILHSFLTVDTPYWYVVVIYAMRMFSVGLIMMPLNTAGLNALHNDELSHGTAIMNSLRIIAGAMGTAISITVMSVFSRMFVEHGNPSGTKEEVMQQATVRGVDAAFIFTTILIVIGFILSAFIKEKKQSNHNVQ